MKKMFLALAVITLVICASSCNKQQKCQCTYKIGAISYESDVFLTQEGETCSEYEDSYNATWGITEADCHRVY